MVQTYYSEGASREGQVRNLFASIARRYDLINDIQSFGLHRYWKHRAVEFALGSCKSGLALDVCCGTGDLSLGLAGRGFSVTGLDFSEPMLEIARSKYLRNPPSRNSDSGKIEYVVGDAMALPFPDHHFDAVTVGYGLRNLKHWNVGLTEMWRVCKPGGRIVCLDFGRPTNGILRGLYFSYLKMIVPCMGKVFCGNWAAYRYILDSLLHFPAQRGIEAEFKKLGAKKLQTLEFLGGTMAINFAEKS